MDWRAKVELFEQIRREYEFGIGTIVGVATKLGVHRRMVREAIGTARAAGASRQILVRGDSAYGNSAVIGACVKAGARFSCVLTKNPAVNRETSTTSQRILHPMVPRNPPASLPEKIFKRPSEENKKRNAPSVAVTARFGRDERKKEMPSKKSRVGKIKDPTPRRYPKPL